MIDAKAVLAGISGGESQGWSAEAWLRDELAGLPVVYRSDAEGNAWATLAGAGDRTVVLGTSGNSAGSRGSERFGFVVAVEAMKALVRKFEGGLPCGVSLLLKTGVNEGAGSKDLSGPTAAGPTAAELEKGTAYLELHTGDGAHGESGAAALGMVTETPGEAVRLSPRLTTLGLEAVEELTGEAPSLKAAASATVTAMAQLGVPSAVMFVAVSEAHGDAADEGQRLHLLQAAEAFGRWVEATAHLLAGDGVDLWALQHRVPHL